MRISAILPHYKTWKMSFYTIHQLLKCRGRHQMDIFVVDNNPADGTAENLKFFGDKIKVVPYPSNLLQSHGIAYDWIIPHLRTEVFATIESDSYPTKENGEWIDWIELLVKDGYDSAGSVLDLSGGQFVHTAGAFYKKSVWQKAKRYVDNMEYFYLPNVAMKDGFPCHLLIHQSVYEQFRANPELFITLSDEYRNQSLPAFFDKKMKEYEPIGRGVFHNGAGRSQEAYSTYRERNLISARDEQEVLMDNKFPFIMRMGYEPGQFFCYWMLANKHKVYSIPTETVWMPNRENQQQEYTITEAGFKHLWAVTAYSDATDPGLMDIIERKKNLMEELYNSIPANERI